MAPPVHGYDIHAPRPTSLLFSSSPSVHISTNSHALCQMMALLSAWILAVARASSALFLSRMDALRLGKVRMTAHNLCNTCVVVVVIVNHSEPR
jgi:hypothetical protein